MKMGKFDLSVVAFALAGGALLSALAGLPFVIGAGLSLIAWSLHPVVIHMHRVLSRIFGERETILFFTLAKSARRDELRRMDFAVLAEHYHLDFAAEGIAEVRKYRRVIEDMNAHLSRFPDRKNALKSTYLRRGLRDLARAVNIEPTNMTRQFDLAMAQVHAHEFKPPSPLKKVTQEIFSRAFGAKAN